MNGELGTVPPHRHAAGCPSATHAHGILCATDCQCGDGTIETPDIVRAATLVSMPTHLPTDLRPEEAVYRALAALSLDNWPHVRRELIDYIERKVEAGK